MKRWIWLTICGLLLTVTGIVSAQDISGTTLDTINLRAQPSIGDNVLLHIPINVNVSIQGRNSIGNWLFITVDGTSGWVSSRYISWDDVELSSIPVTEAPASAPAQPAPTTANPIINTGNAMSGTTRARLNVRSVPDIAGNVVTTLNYGTTVTVIGRNVDQSWVAIDTGTTRGWVASGYLDYSGNINTLPVQGAILSAPVAPAVNTIVADTPSVEPAQTRSGSYVITGPAPNNSSSYDMEITLHWNTTANLNLRVTGPDGYTIVPGVPPSPTGGYFQQPVGANEDCNTAEGAAIEVVTWDKGTAPSGNYHIDAEFVNSCFPDREEETLFWVSVKNDGPEVEFWVYFIEPGELFEFDFTRP